jgi:hypothetical protein
MTNIGAQRFPHKYVKREWRNGKWVYFYAAPNVGLSQATRGAESHSVVIAHGKPTQIMVDPTTSDIVFGPPNIVGKRLFVNTRSKGSYFGVAKDPEGVSPPTYLYPEGATKTLAQKKAAKFVKASRALTLLNKHAETLMNSRDPVAQDYGLAIWLNNNTQMRIGAHDDASSVDPKERAKIINVARKENWGAQTKQTALEMARKQTYGLLSMRVGHMSFAHGGSPIVTFRFTGKGGKENVYVSEVTPRVHQLLFQKKYLGGGSPESRVFGEKVNYKKLWRTYKSYGITPHVSRGAYAEHLVRQLMEDFRVFDGESASAAVRRFNSQLTENVSNHLNHSRSMTEKSYLTASTRQAVNDFREALRSKVGQFRESTSKEPSDALGEAILWGCFGVGNTVI